MKKLSMYLLLVALTSAACGGTYAPTVEMTPVRPDTAAPAVAPSPTAPPSEAVPVPATTEQIRPMSDNEATTPPARNAPAPTSPVSGDRCNGTTNPKSPPPACP